MRRDYFSRLSLAARWYLPPAEAAEALEDRRWRAMYIWGLTGVVLNSFLWQVFTSMNLTDGYWQGSYWIRLVFITLAGLIGTGLSLR